MRYQIGTSPAQRLDAMRRALARPPAQASYAIRTVDGLGGLSGHACASCSGAGVARPLGELGAEAPVERSMVALIGVAAAITGFVGGLIWSKR